MAESKFTGRYGLTNTGGAEFGHRRGPSVAFDTKVGVGVDPEAAWRFGNSTKYRRVGSTAAQRADKTAGYTPGYGASSGSNTTGASSLTPKVAWNEQFTPQLGARMADRTQPPPIQGPTQTGNTLDRGFAAPATVPPVTMPTPSSLPPAATPPEAPLSTPSPGDIGIQQINGAGQILRRVTGLPAGQRASATFVPGQNNPTELAKRKTPTISPFS